MRKQAAIVVALLAMAWPCSYTKMAAVQPLTSWPPDQQDDVPAMPGPPLPSPPFEFDRPDYPLQESPQHQEYETAEPALPAPELETSVPTPPHHKQSPLSPQMVPSPFPPASPGSINNSATAWTTVLVFGDSMVDPGNNNRLETAAKANFLPYGMSFYGGKPTGRFSNGCLITDILAEKLGVGRSIPGFHDPKLKPEQLMAGVSFASAGSGYDDTTARRSNVLSFSNQLEDLWHYKRNLKRLVGPGRAEQLVKKATFVISAGTTDLLFRYLPSNQSAEDTELKYENQLIARVANYTQEMKNLGGRRFIFVGVPPIGCLPFVRTLLGTGPEKCHGNMNSLATLFNKKLVKLAHLLNNKPYTRATFIDIYTTIARATIDPGSFGLTETSRGCCGTGMIEVGQTCRGQTTCTDPSKYLYWDAVHQTERINQIVIDDVLMNSIRGI